MLIPIKKGSTSTKDTLPFFRSPVQAQHLLFYTFIRVCVKKKTPFRYSASFATSASCSAINLP